MKQQQTRRNGAIISEEPCAQLNRTNQQKEMIAKNEQSDECYGMEWNNANRTKTSVARARGHMNSKHSTNVTHNRYVYFNTCANHHHWHGSQCEYVEFSCRTSGRVTVISSLPPFGWLVHMH